MGWNSVLPMQGVRMHPGQGTRSHRLQLKILCAKTWHSTINAFFKKWHHHIFTFYLLSSAAHDLHFIRGVWSSERWRDSKLEIGHWTVGFLLIGIHSIFLGGFVQQFLYTFCLYIHSWFPVKWDTQYISWSFCSAVSIYLLPLYCSSSSLRIVFNEHLWARHSARWLYLGSLPFYIRWNCLGR